MQFEGDVLHHLAGVQVLHLQHHRRVRRDHGMGLRRFVNHTADHHVDDVVLCAFLGDQRADVAAVAHDADPVRDDFDLIHPVGNVYDAQLLRPQIPDDLEQLVDLRLRQRGGRLVKDDDLRFMADGLGDLTHLLFADGEVAHLLGRVDVDAQLVEKFLRFFVHAGVVNQEALFELPADKDVLGNGQMVHHVQFLVNDDDTGFLRLPGVMEFDFLSFIGDGPFIFGIDAGQHLHQGGFARAVLSHQRVYFSLAHLQIHMIQCMYAGEGLVDPLHCQNYFAQDTSSIPFTDSLIHFL